jgi:ABC-type dipeptide/oligopeptide/nickel transport system ATPase subunit
MSGDAERFSMEIVSIVIQHPSNSLDPVAEDMFQFRALNLVERPLNVIKGLALLQ